MAALIGSSVLIAVEREDLADTCPDTGCARVGDVVTLLRYAGEEEGGSADGNN